MMIRRAGSWACPPGRRDMGRRWILLLSVLILLSGCSKEIAQIGEISLSERDLSLRAKVSEVYYPGSGRRYVALAQLIKGYLSWEILRSMGHRVDPETLQGEAKRIEEKTQAPQVLERVKQVYGRDRKGYLNTFVRVVYGERVLYNEVFLNSREIHRKESRQAEEFLQEALQSPASFRGMARKRGLQAVALRLSLREGILPWREEGRERRSSSGSGIEQAKRLMEALSRTKPGEVYPEVIEWLEGFQVIRYLRKEGKDLVVQSVSIAKRDYEEWFWEKASKIPVRIYDHALREELLREVAWARNLKL